MAENVKKSLNEDFIRCTICKEIYKEPKILPCLHSFCFHCLKQWVTNHQTQPLACPTCGCTVDLPSKDVQSLPQNFFLISLIERSEEVRRLSTEHKDLDCNICRNKESTTFCLVCEMHFCSDCKGTHERLTRSSSHLVIPSEKVCQENYLEKTISSQAPYCHSHKQEKVNYFCTQCHQLVCQRCAIVLHQGHLEIQEVENRASSVRNTFENLLKKNKALTGAVSDKLRQTEITTKKTKREASELLSKLNARYDEIIAKLESDKEKLRNEIKQIQESKCTKLGDMESKISTCLKAFGNAQEMIRTILEQSNAWDILKMETDIAKACESLQAHKDRVVKLSIAGDVHPNFLPSKLMVLDDIKENKLKRYIENELPDRRPGAISRKKTTLSEWLKEENFIGKIKLEESPPLCDEKSEITLPEYAALSLDTISSKNFPFLGGL